MKRRITQSNEAPQDVKGVLLVPNVGGNYGAERFEAGVEHCFPVDVAATLLEQGLIDVEAEKRRQGEA
jgi:hypothetical protein